MRTKLILTTAALGVSSLGAMAQVYSVNAVGYINVTIPAGDLAIVGNQLNTGGNTIAEVIPTTADDTTVYKYTQATGFSVNTFFGGAWGTPTEVIKPGEAFFISNAGATDLTITFVGEVPQGPLSTPLVSGFNLVASQVPQAGALSGALGYTAADDDIVYQFNVGTQAYVSSTYFGGWAPADPVIAVGEGFFLSKAAAGTWDRTFSVNP